MYKLEHESQIFYSNMYFPLKSMEATYMHLRKEFGRNLAESLWVWLLINRPIWAGQHGSWSGNVSFNVEVWGQIILLQVSAETLIHIVIIKNRICLIVQLHMLNILQEMGLCRKCHSFLCILLLLQIFLHCSVLWAFKIKHMTDL